MEAKKKKKKSRLLIEESGLSFGKAFILHPSPGREHSRSYFTIQLTHEKLLLGTQGVNDKKIAEKEKHLWEDIQSKKLQEPSEPSLSLSGVVQLQTQTTLPK